MALDYKGRLASEPLHQEGANFHRLYHVQLQVLVSSAGHGYKDGP